ncbi:MULTISPECIES: ATP-binding protein [Nocardiopsis]|jgi:serine/threonine-protein kinase RsbW|uniref:ATP-binding protein n=3 Tax=Nocardiopsis alba TaxID=53437 RepID=A0A7K2IPU6_9ACTN|nr:MULTISPECIES: ATP-binding protein [Nocardiopsis]AFR09723.1 histidine kinase-like ATPase domain protein [Nocardiopsis alba ATCC BAA-2165]MEC3895882.1 ATP-binding protein [Nocardiopsis sp. LDBS1602]MYR31825.1 ATP-binding protein [Nocardiopsis alba]
MAEARQLRDYVPAEAPEAASSTAPTIDVGDLTGGVTDHTVWSCAGNLTAVRSIRARVREFLTRTGHSEGALDDAELAVSELATNALLHSRSGQSGGVMTLFIRSDEQRLRVAVADQGAREPEGVADEHTREDGDDYGRGKLIVDNCATRSGEYWSDATHVAWFEIDDEGSAARDS